MKQSQSFRKLRPVMILVLTALLAAVAAPPAQAARRSTDTTSSPTVGTGVKPVVSPL